MLRIAAFLMLWGTTATAQAGYQFPSDAQAADFVANEVIATFYHELGHALIDVLGLAVLGKEEDAADNLSVILMNDIWEEPAAVAILTSDAKAFALRADQLAAGGEEPVYSDEHSLDIQRYYNVVCLFYGADPEARQGLADGLGLPEERAEKCPSEWETAAGSWDAALAEAKPGGANKGLVMAAADQPLADLLREEVTAINAHIGLPVQITVELADCGEANAFYDPERRAITLCNEYAQDVQQLWESRKE